VARRTLDKLADVSPDLAEGFRALRSGAMRAGPLPHETIELVVVATLAATQQHGSLNVHLRRLLAADVDPAAIRHAIVATLGAAATVAPVIEALDILEELTQEGER
jgi:alkylhydroperoxidase/carboxymuconolactone decarboxylase family protein YurZ